MLLKPGSQIKHDGRIFDFTHTTNDDEFCFKNLQNGSVVTLKLKEVEKAFIDGRLQCHIDIKKEFPHWKEVAMRSDFMSRPLSHRLKAFKNKDYCDAILAAGEPKPCHTAWVPILERVAETNDEDAPSVDSVKRWLKPYKNRDCDVRALLPGYGARGRKRKVRDAAEDTFLAAMISLFQSPECPSKQRIVEIVRDGYEEARRRNPLASRWKAPCKSTIIRMIDELDRVETVLRREGADSARRKFAGVGEGFEPTRRLELVELDHTRADIMVVDNDRSALLGRPWICFAIDKRTRMILGFYIGFHPPSAASLMQCLHHMILPKHYLEEDPVYAELGLTWMAYGVPAAVLVDNAKENHSSHFLTACACLGIQVNYATVMRPEIKGTIERFNGSFATSAYSWLPGRTFGSVAEKGDYEPEKHACMTLTELKLHIHRWILADYAVRTHRGINAVPAMRWEQEVKEYPVRMPASAKDLDVLLGISGTHTIQKNGITIDDLTYYSPELVQIRQIHSGKVVTKRNEDDVGRIAVVHPITQELLYVNCKNRHAWGVSSHQHDRIRAIARAEGATYMNQDVYLKARIAMREAASNLLRNKRSSHKQRNRAARVLGGSNTMMTKATAIIENPERDLDLEEILQKSAPVPLSATEAAKFLNGATPTSGYTPKAHSTAT